MKVSIINTVAITAFAVIGFATLSSSVVAQSAVTTQAAAPLKDPAEAEVRRIDKDAKKVTLKHGPIKSLDMPPMTMVFQVRDVTLLDKFAVGDKIMFTAEQLQGAYVMTGVEKSAK
jgi:Cu(I)/Ag(I) efflux system periplasmic protein CusF